ncbi:beta-N-acetylhexosaminidase [Streptococcus pyogenes]|nr:beta-N-acetylhexosaminidase [Streptococcus pyogenes]VHE77006.1 beta-N-acetylhexosaminidase [Streptococcus pyogenes]VHE93419.1 beta-N-acetylhexosaminidase [Streptococcus pyogenes]VHG78372.1 beta-N-acetylhexosaminidase [Streptococcus pyogenes]
MKGTPEQMQGLLNELQSHSKIPLLVAANCDSGGDGAVKCGTYIASRAQSEASHDPWLVYYAGLVSAREETSSRRQY